MGCGKVTLCQQGRGDRERVGLGMGKSDLKMKTEELNILEVPGPPDCPNSPPGV